MFKHSSLLEISQLLALWILGYWYWHCSYKGSDFGLILTRKFYENQNWLLLMQRRDDVKNCSYLKGLKSYKKKLMLVSVPANDGKVRLWVEVALAMVAPDCFARDCRTLPVFAALVYRCTLPPMHCGPSWPFENIWRVLSDIERINLRECSEVFIESPGMMRYFDTNMCPSWSMVQWLH